MHRDTHYDPEIFEIDFSEPFILGIVPGDRTKGHIHYPQAIEPILAQAVLPITKSGSLSASGWKPDRPLVSFFPTGPTSPAPQ